MRFLFWLRWRQKAKTYSAYYSWFSILSRQRANLCALIAKKSFRFVHTTRTHAIILSWLSFFSCVPSMLSNDVCRVKCVRCSPLLTRFVEEKINLRCDDGGDNDWKTATTREREKKLVNCTTAASHQLSNESQNFYISFNFILFLVHFFMFEKNRNAFP